MTNWFFEKKKHVARMIRKGKERIQVTNIRNERGNITIESTDIKDITRE